MLCLELLVQLDELLQVLPPGHGSLLVLLEELFGALREAEAYHGPSLVIGYSPCEMHSIKGGMANCQSEMKKAVACGYWNLFRYNPALRAEGKNPFTLDSKAPAGGYQTSC